MCHLIHFLRIDTSEDPRAGSRIFREDIQHFTDGCDADEGFFGEGKGEGNRSNQLVLDVNGTSTHSGEHSRRVNRFACQPRQNQIVFWPDVLQNTQNLNLKSFHPGPFEDCPSVSLLPRFDQLQRIEVSRLANQGNGSQER